MIWQLAIESSGSQASFAALHGDRLVQEVVLSKEERTTAAIGPALNTLMRRLEAEGGSLGFVSVSRGPGSFTGLRIGVTAAKTLCFATNCHLVAVDSLEVLCHEFRQRLHLHPEFDADTCRMISVGTNAYRKQLFMRIEPILRTEDFKLEDSKIVDQEIWDQFRLRQDTCTLGREGDDDASDMSFDPPLQRTVDRWPRNSASWLGQLGWQLYQQGQRDDHWKLVPNYLRKSAAEEKAERKESPLR